jgi:neutral ceramidase
VYSFAAGTTDGPGDFDFVQGTNSSKTNPYWNWLARFIADPPKEQVLSLSLRSLCFI